MKQPLILCDASGIDNLYPLTLTRPGWDLRMGIFTQRERWTYWLDNQEVFGKASSYLASFFDHLPVQERVILINSAVFPDKEVIRCMEALSPSTYFVTKDGDWLMAELTLSQLVSTDSPISTDLLEKWGLKGEQVSVTPLIIRYPEEIFRHNGEIIQRDFPLAARIFSQTSVKDPYTRIYGADNLFVSEGANIKAAIINAEEGPIFIGPEAKVSEGAIIARPHAICAHATVAMGAKLRGDTTLGPWCKAGGEVSNSVMMGYSNKGHDGYLGNSVLGYWCNLGADTNNSNLKNNYAEVKLWHYRTQRFRKTGLQFAGLIMGDHSKCAINTMFNTGTVVGVSANIFGAGFPRNFVPSFSWGGASGMQVYMAKKAIEVARIVKERRNLRLTTEEADILKAVFEHTAQYRRF